MVKCNKQSYKCKLNTLTPKAESAWAQACSNFVTCAPFACEGPFDLAVGVLMPSLANGETTTPPGDTAGDPSSFEVAPLAAAAVAVALVVLRGVVSCSLPKGVQGGLGGDTLVPSGAVRTSWYQASNACISVTVTGQTCHCMRCVCFMQLCQRSMYLESWVWCAVCRTGLL